MKKVIGSDREQPSKGKVNMAYQTGSSAEVILAILTTKTTFGQSTETSNKYKKNGYHTNEE